MGGLKPVKIFGNATCPYCGAARMLLTKKGIEFEDIDVTANPASFSTMTERSGNRTVPQVFIGDASIGGFDELYALERSGELDEMLAD